MISAQNDDVSYQTLSSIQTLYFSIMAIKHHKIHGMENIEHYSGTYIREVLNSSPADLNATLHIDVNPLRKAGHVLM